MKLGYFSLLPAALMPAGQAYTITHTYDYAYNAFVEHVYVAWTAHQESEKTESKKEEYEKIYNEVSRDVSLGVDVATPAGLEVGVETSFGWKDIKETETKVTTFDSHHKEVFQAFQEGISLVLRVATKKSCFGTECHENTIKDIVGYTMLREGGVTDEEDKKWTEKSFEFLNEFMLMPGMKNVTVQDYGYAAVDFHADVTTYRHVNKYWKSGRYGKRLTCDDGEVITGICGSGWHADCRDDDGHKVFTKIQCSDELNLSTEKCDSWKSDKGKHINMYCPVDFPVLKGYCGSGKDKNCAGGFGNTKCCRLRNSPPIPTPSTSQLEKTDPFRGEMRRVLTLFSNHFPSNFPLPGRWIHGIARKNNQIGNVNDKCHWKGGGHGEDVDCPDGYIVTGSCGSGKDPHCDYNRLYSNILCCKIE